jgi:DNA-binding transcriptional MerR regulator
MNQDSSAETFYSVTELAHLLDVTPRTIRFYEQKDLLAPQRAGKTRVYTHRDKARLQIILRGKRLGFSLAEIKEFLDLYDTDRTQQSQLNLLLAKIGERIESLEAQQRDLQQTLKELYQVQAEAKRALSERIQSDSDAA